MAFRTQADWEQQEASEYRAGQRVELKHRPGIVHIIAEYDPMMVPPIWLANDPQPRYPEELNVLPKLVPDWFNPAARRNVRNPACRVSRDRIRETALLSR